MKKFFGLFLALILFVGVFPISFSACGKTASTVEEEQLSEEDLASSYLFVFNKTTIGGVEGYSVFRYKGTNPVVVIPSTYRNLPVLAISPLAFSQKSVLSVFVPDSVVSIGKEAFFQCVNLVSVQLSNNLTEIKESTFENCVSLESIVIPDFVETIGVKAFNACVELKHIQIGASVSKIGFDDEFGVYKASFDICPSLEFFDFGDSIACYSDDEFSGCSNLKSIRYGRSVLELVSAFDIGSFGSGTSSSGDFDLYDYDKYVNRTQPVLEEVIITSNIVSIDANFFSSFYTSEFNTIVIEGVEILELQRVFDLICAALENFSVFDKSTVSIVVENEEIANALSVANNEIEGGGFSAIIVAE